MELRDYIKALGDQKAAALFGVKARTAMSWRLGERQPRPRQAHKIIEATQGLVGWQDIYSPAETEAA